MKAVKFGNSLRNIAPEHSNSYYLPDKRDYIDTDQMYKRKVHLKHLRMQARKANGTTFITDPEIVDRHSKT